MKRMRSGILLLAFIIPALLAAYPARAQAAVVHAVLFFSPTCPHCHQVMEKDLPPLKDRYGDQLEILEIDASTEQGARLYMAAVEQFQVPQERFGVPALYVGDTLLVGSLEIPEKFPGLIEAVLAQGGNDWPDIPGLDEYLAERGVEVGRKQDLLQRFSRDLAGNTLSVIVLLGMIGSAIRVRSAFRTKPRRSVRQWPGWVVPTLAIIGLGIASYLSYIEITRTEAVCGPVGDCNSVQQSPYAMLFGVLPIGVLGAAGYLLIFAAWLIQRAGPDRWRRWGALAVWGLAWFGLLFSIYLTFLEPFIIGATCIWCLSSAVVITLILWASTGPARQAWKKQPAARARKSPI